MTVEVEVIRAGRYMEVGEVIQRDSGLLLDRWARRAAEEQPGAQCVHRAALLDHLPNFLHELGNRLQEAGDPENRPHCRPAQQHGEQRWQDGWSVGEVVRDYRILRLVVLEHLEATLGRPLGLREAEAVALVFDEAIEESVTRFAASRDEYLLRLREERTAGERAAARELLRWQQVFGHARWGMALLRPSDQALFTVNPALARMHGRPAEELTGRPLTDLLTPESRAAWPERASLILAQGHHTFEAAHLHADGSSYPVLTAVAAFRDGADGEEFWAASFQDISERKRLEEQLRAQDRRKDEFLATLAHELRNHLAPLGNSLALLRLEGDKPETVWETAEFMGRQVSQMSRLMDDLLDVARVAQGKLVLRKVRIDLREVAAQAARTSASILESRRHRLTVDVPPEPLWVDADEARLIQVAVNLLNNAAKYTPEVGHIRLTVAREGGEAVLQVRDNGLGISADMLERIFDLFTQLEPGDERASGGLGIGLTLVRRLVELHGGTIAAASAGPGQGSTFTVRLASAAASPSAAGKAENGRPAVSGRHVLIVEDNADGRETLARLLRRLGHQVSVAEDGPRGVDAGLALRPEVVLIDIGLPGLDGYQVAAQLRAGLGSGAILVALTGRGQPDDVKRAREAGCDAHLVKPVDFDALGALLALP